jgi:hypothetical protein
MAWLNEVVIARYECEWHACVQQKVRNFWAVSSTDTDVQEHSIEISLCKFLSRYSHGMGDAGNAVASLSDHLFDQHPNQRLIFDDQDTRSTLSSL